LHQANLRLRLWQNLHLWKSLQRLQKNLLLQKSRNLRL
jgi:hypothetical protein